MGKILQDPAYTSTSKNREVAKEFASDAAPNIIRIIETCLCEKGFKGGVDISSICYYPEAEILLGRNVERKVIAAEKINDNTVHIYTRICM